MKTKLAGVVKPDLLYFILAITFGIGFVFISPPFQVPDEPTHFFRSAQIAEGEGIKTYSKLPLSLIDFYNHILKSDLPHNPGNRINPITLVKEFFRPLSPNETIFYWTSATNFYPPLVYLPQASAIILGRLLAFSPYAILLLSRAFNLFSAIFLTTSAIFISPVRKWTLLFISLLPMCLFQYASVSADALTISFCYFYISLVLKLCHNNQLTYRQVTGLIIATIFLALIKPGYVLLSFITFIIPNINHLDNRKNILLKLGVVLLGMSIFLSWVYISGMVNGNMPSVIPGSNLIAQIEYVLSQPLRFLDILWSDFWDKFPLTYIQFIGILGWLDTSLPFFAYILFSIILMFLLVFDNCYEMTIALQKRTIIFGIFLILLFVFFGTFYFIWTPVGANEIQGFQGRYIYPIVFLLFSVSYIQRLKAYGKLLPYFLLMFWIIGTLLSFKAMILRYYL